MKRFVWEAGKQPSLYVCKPLFRNNSPFHIQLNRDILSTVIFYFCSCSPLHRFHSFARSTQNSWQTRRIPIGKPANVVNIEWNQINTTTTFQQNGIHVDDVLDVKEGEQIGADMMSCIQFHFMYSIQMQWVWIGFDDKNGQFFLLVLCDFGSSRNTFDFWSVERIQLCRCGKWLAE